jgi:hypothetical protein
VEDPADEMDERALRQRDGCRVEQMHEFSLVSKCEVDDNGHEGRRVSSTPRLCQENERGY